MSIFKTPFRECNFPCSTGEVMNGQCRCRKDLDDGINKILKTFSKQSKPFFFPDFESLDFKKMRKHNSYTIRQVEEATGISNAYLSQLENGKIKNPSYNTVITLLRFYKY